MMNGTNRTNREAYIESDACWSLPSTAKEWGGHALLNGIRYEDGGIFFVPGPLAAADKRPETPFEARTAAVSGAEAPSASGPVGDAPDMDARTIAAA